MIRSRTWPCSSVARADHSPPASSGAHGTALACQPQKTFGVAHLCNPPRGFARGQGHAPDTHSAILALVKGYAPDTPAALRDGAPTLRASRAGTDVAIAHLSIRPQSRSRGQSFAQALAYRHGLHLRDCHTGRSHDYIRRADRQEIAATGLARPPGLDPAITLDDTAAAQHLADLVDSAETRRNSCIGRDFEGSLPAALNAKQRLALAESWSETLAHRYSTPVPWAIHAPPADGDARNWHIHALVPDRALAPDGAALGPKIRILADRRTGPGEVKEIRRAWEDHVNAHLKAAGIEARIDMGRTRPADRPSVHLGPKRTGRERQRQARRRRYRDPRPDLDGTGVLARVVATESLDQVAVVAYLAAGEQYETPPALFDHAAPAPELPTPTRQRQARPTKALARAPARVETHAPALDTPAPRQRRRRHRAPLARAPEHITPPTPELPTPPPTRQHRREPLARAPAPLEPQTLTRAPRPPRQRRRRQREPLARAPDPSRRQQATRTIERLEILEAIIAHSESTRRSAALADLEELAHDMEKPMPAPGPGPAHVQAHADGHGRPVPATLEPAETAAEKRVSQKVAADGHRLRIAIEERGSAIAEEMILERAGLPAPPLAPKDQLRRQWTAPAVAELSRHVEPFCIAPAAKPKSTFGFYRDDSGEHQTNARNAIGQWRAHWQTNGREIVSGILAIMWSRSRQGDHADEVRARFEREAEITADETRRQPQPPTVVPAPAPDRSTWPGRGGSGIGS